MSKFGLVMFLVVRGYLTINVFFFVYKYVCRVVSVGWFSALTTLLRRRAVLGVYSFVCFRRWSGAFFAYRVRVGSRNFFSGFSERRFTGFLVVGAAGKEGIRRVEGTRSRGYVFF